MWFCIEIFPLHSIPSPSWELTYSPIPAGTLESMIFLFPFGGICFLVPWRVVIPVFRRCAHPRYSIATREDRPRIRGDLVVRRCRWGLVCSEDNRWFVWGFPIISWEGCVVAPLFWDEKWLVNDNQVDLLVLCTQKLWLIRDKPQKWLLWEWDPRFWTHDIWSDVWTDSRTGAIAAYKKLFQ